MDKLPVAVIGVGYLGKFHAEKYAASEAADLRAVVDSDQDRAQQIAKDTGSQAVADYKELPNLGVKAVSIASSTSTHFEIAAWMLANGVDVLVEKPMTTTVSEAEELIRLAEENDRILQVGHLERFNPAFRAVQESLDKPIFFEVRRISPFSGRGQDVDVVLDLMIHDIDIVAHLVGRPLEHVDAVGVSVLTDSCDIANARLSFEGGAVANVTASRAAFKSERSLRVFQPDVYVSLDYENKKLKLYRRELAEGDALPKLSIVEHDVEERDALRDEIHSFLNCVATRETPVVTGTDGKRALLLAARIKSAIEERREMIASGDGISGVLEQGLGSSDRKLPSAENVRQT